MNAGIFSIFLLLLLTSWAALPAWAWATWASRRNPYVRARQPAWLVAELTYSTLAATIICIDEMLRCRELVLPCRLIKLVAALNVVVMPALVVFRSLQLW